MNDSTPSPSRVPLPTYEATLHDPQRFAAEVMGHLWESLPSCWPKPEEHALDAAGSAIDTVIAAEAHDELRKAVGHWRDAANNMATGAYYSGAAMGVAIECFRRSILAINPRT